MVQTDHHVLATKKQAWVQTIYQKYASMLFGYLTDALESEELAEKCLIDVFSYIVRTSHEQEWNKPNNWCLLLKYTHARLKPYIELTSKSKPTTDYKVKQQTSDAILNQLTAEQKFIFCEFYYRGKKAHVIANSINKTEELTRKILKEAFDIIRRSCES